MLDKVKVTMLSHLWLMEDFCSAVLDAVTIGDTETFEEIEFLITDVYSLEAMLAEVGIKLPGGEA